MSLLAALTVKVSAILLLVLAGALCLRTRSAAARRWVLAIGEPWDRPPCGRAGP